MTESNIPAELIKEIEEMILRRMDSTGEDHVTASAHIRLYLSQHLSNIKK